MFRLHVVCVSKAVVIPVLVSLLVSCGAGDTATPNQPAAGSSASVLLSIVDSSIAEGDAGVSPVTITVSISPAASSPIQVNYATRDGFAKVNSDYRATQGTLNIPTGATFATLEIPVIGDTLAEIQESFDVILSNANAADIATNAGVARITILDNDVATVLPVISVSDASLVESDLGVQEIIFEVVVTGDVNQDVAVHYATQAVPEGATEGVDFIGKSETLLLLATDTVPSSTGERKKNIRITVLGDLAIEADETFQLVLSDPQVAVLGRSIASGHILDDDTPLLSVVGGSVVEADSGSTDLVFTLDLNKAQATDSVISYQVNTNASTAVVEQDYSAATSQGTITLPAGMTQIQLRVPIIGDTEPEATETLVLQFTPPSGFANNVGTNVGTLSASGQILDNEVVALTVSGGSVIEGNSENVSLVFTVSASTANHEAITFTYSTQNGGNSSANFADFVSVVNQPVTLAAGVLTTYVTVVVKPDTVLEANETVAISVAGLSTNAQLSIASQPIVGTIIDNDLAVSVAGAELVEGQTGFSNLLFPLIFNGSRNQAITLNYSSSDGSAIAGQDYVAQTNGSVTVQAGVAPATIAIQIIGDSVREADETFTLSIQASDLTYSIGTANAVGRILDDEPLQVSVGDITVFEGSSKSSVLIFPVTLDTPAKAMIRISYATRDGSATTLTSPDYVAANASLTIPSGQQQAWFFVNVQADRVVELDEQLQVDLAVTQGNAVLTRSSVVGTIADDDNPAINGLIALPKTGQTQCYRDTGVMRTCPGSGQDAEVLAGYVSPTVADRPGFDASATPANSVMVDKLTGLAWPVDANAMPVLYPGLDQDAAVDDGVVGWLTAATYINSLNMDTYLGYSDWRLPNRNELHSLIHYGDASGTWLMSFAGFSNIPAGFYWTSTADGANYPVTAPDAWVQRLDTGEQQTQSKTLASGYVLPVRDGALLSYVHLPMTGQTQCFASDGSPDNDCVIPGQDGQIQSGVIWPVPRFKPSGPNSELIKDLLTGLYVSKTADPSAVVGTWAAALSYVATLNTSGYLGYSDWRMPNINELQSLMSNSDNDADWFANGVGITPPSTELWSSTTYQAATEQAWIMSPAAIGAQSKVGFSAGVIPVRGQQ